DLMAGLAVGSHHQAPSHYNFGDHLMAERCTGEVGSLDVVDGNDQVGRIDFTTTVFYLHFITDGLTRCVNPGGIRQDDVDQWIVVTGINRHRIALAGTTAIGYRHADLILA